MGKTWCQLFFFNKIYTAACVYLQYVHSFSISSVTHYYLKYYWACIWDVPVFNMKQNLPQFMLIHGPLIRYVKLRVAPAPELPGTFSPPRGFAIQTCITACAWRNAVIHTGIADSRFPLKSVAGKVPGIPGACATHNHTYLVRGLWILNCHIVHIHKIYGCEFGRKDAELLVNLIRIRHLISIIHNLNTWS